MPDIHEAIEKARKTLGPRVAIVGHHYQSDGIIRHVQISGDSLELSQKVAAIEAENIVFCGVHFMAESAALLARPGQKVYLPAPDANCVMAQMTPAPLLDAALEKLCSGGQKVLPLAYVNTSFAVKAVVGKYGGAVCTSANAERMMRWAFKQSDKVLFLPDKNLGRNTAKQLGLMPEEQLILDVRGKGSRIGSITPSAKLLLWPGLCAIHARFKLSHINELRAKHPGIKIAVHPECPPEIVNASDAAGSTSFLIRFAQETPDGAVIAIGTEINLVRRLMLQHKGRITILPLFTSACSDMAKTTPEALLSCLTDIISGQGRHTPVTVDEQTAPPARAALNRMLDACRS